MAGDPFFNNVSLLLHADVSDGGLVDYSPAAHTITAHGNAQINADSPEFGDGSAYFDGIKTTGPGTGEGGGHFLVEKDGAFDFGSNDFTVELILTPNELKYAIFFSTNQSLSPYFSIRFQMDVDGSVSCLFNTNGLATINTTIDSGPVLSIGTSTYIALSVENQVARLFIDGVLKAQDTLTGPLPNYSSYPVQIGVDYASGSLNSTRPYLNAYIDEMRVTEGVARYVEDFTVQTEPHPNFIFVPSVSGNITESSQITDWIVTLVDKNGSIAGSGIFSSSTYEIFGVSGMPYYASLAPKIDHIWIASTAVALNDYIAAADSLGDWHVWQCTTPGTTHTSEPVWITPGTTNDNDVVWTYIAELPKPTIEGPLVAT